MPAERLPMRKLHELLRLRLANGLTQRAIARSLGLSQGAVCEYLGRARRAGLSWPEVSSLDEAELERLLFPPPPAIPAEQRPQPDWAVDAYDGAEEIERAWLDGLKPDPLLTVSEWADRHRVLSQR